MQNEQWQARVGAGWSCLWAAALYWLHAAPVSVNIGKDGPSRGAMTRWAAQAGRRRPISDTGHRPHRAHRRYRPRRPRWWALLKPPGSTLCNRPCWGRPVGQGDGDRGRVCSGAHGPGEASLLAGFCDGAASQGVRQEPGRQGAWPGGRGRRASSQPTSQPAAANEGRNDPCFLLVACFAALLLCWLWAAGLAPSSEKSRRPGPESCYGRSRSAAFRCSQPGRRGQQTAACSSRASLATFAAALLRLAAAWLLLAAGPSAASCPSRAKTTAAQLWRGPAGESPALPAALPQPRRAHASSVHRPVSTVPRPPPATRWAGRQGDAPGCRA